jgi:hypothetical protein
MSRRRFQNPTGIMDIEGTGRTAVLANSIAQALRCAVLVGHLVELRGAYSAGFRSEAGWVVGRWADKVMLVRNGKCGKRMECGHGNMVDDAMCATLCWFHHEKKNRVAMNGNEE